MTIPCRRITAAFSIIFLLLVILINNATVKEVYTEAVTLPITATQISNSDSEISSNTTAATNTSLANLEAQNKNQNMSTTTITLSTTITVTSVLIHTTTLTFMMTISRGVAESQVVTFVVVIGTITIIVGYLVGYRSAMSKQREVVPKVQKRGRA